MASLVTELLRTVERRQSHFILVTALTTLAAACVSVRVPSYYVATGIVVPPHDQPMPVRTEVETQPMFVTVEQHWAYWQLLNTCSDIRAHIAHEAGIDPKFSHFYLAPERRGHLRIVATQPTERGATNLVQAVARYTQEGRRQSIEHLVETQKFVRSERKALNARLSLVGLTTSKERDLRSGVEYCESKDAELQQRLSLLERRLSEPRFVSRPDVRRHGVHPLTVILFGPVLGMLLGVLAAMVGSRNTERMDRPSA